MRKIIITIVVCFLAMTGCTGEKKVAAPMAQAESGIIFPPDNPYLADSPWPMSHRNPYNQASSPYPGPDGSSETGHGFIESESPSVMLLYSAPYPDGGRAVWGSNVVKVFKLSVNGPEIGYLAELGKSGAEDPIVGAYTLLDADGIYYVPTAKGIIAYRDVDPSDSGGAIKIRSEFSIGDAEVHGKILGINITYDGRIVFASSGGTIGVVSRDFGEYQLYQLGEDEEISNSIAVDEDGGIYIVTSKLAHRLQWTGKTLSDNPADGAWTAEYEAGSAETATGRLGTGSGSTPTLMGVGAQDKFMVITDGAKLMNLVLMWRDKIPEDWTPIAPGKDRRIAAEVPVTFGDPTTDSSLSEQSVMVAGYGAVVVNNDYGPGAPSGMAAVIAGLVAYGVEKFEWDPRLRQLKSVWANPAIACPNGIPTFSSATELIYCIGNRDGAWTLEGIDWADGKSSMHHIIGDSPSYNSAYSATEIGPDSNIISGALFGAMNIY